MSYNEKICKLRSFNQLQSFYQLGAFSQLRALRQSGAILIIALVFLLLITLLGISSSNTNIQQLLMAGNEQSRIEAVQRAQALVDGILDNEDNIPLSGNVGFRTCAFGDVDAICDSSVILLAPKVTAVLNGGNTSYFATRMGPLTAPVPPLNEELASSSSAYQIALVEVDATFDGTASRQGTSNIVQGIMLLVPAGQQ